MEDNIYSSVPDELMNRDEKDFQTRKLILDFLKNYKNKYFKAVKIAEIFSLPKKSTQVRVRHLITQLIELDNQPIISSSKGFAYTDKPELILDYINSLGRRNKGIVRRITKLKSICSRMYARDV